MKWCNFIQILLCQRGGVIMENKTHFLVFQNFWKNVKRFFEYSLVPLYSEHFLKTFSSSSSVIRISRSPKKFISSSVQNRVCRPVIFFVWLLIVIMSENWNQRRRQNGNERQWRSIYIIAKPANLFTITEKNRKRLNWLDHLDTSTVIDKLDCNSRH